jgi:hypothetical protein
MLLVTGHGWRIGLARCVYFVNNPLEVGDENANKVGGQQKDAAAGSEKILG